jgi:thiosulfate/3-mercaptopyruvate sulfurtransferase
VRASVLAVVAVAGVSSFLHAEDNYPRAALLVEPCQLSKPDVARQFVILDARKAEEYEKEHLSNALRVDHDQWKSAWRDGQDAAGWSKRIGDLGIGADSKVVVYDDKGMKDAARIWWILRYWGVQDVRLLNGGWRTWTAKGHKTDRKSPALRPVSFRGNPRSNTLATMDQVLQLLKNDAIQIVDTRSSDEFCGIEKRDNKKGGAIPGAKHLEWSDLICQETHRFKSPKELRRLFGESQIDLSRPTATHCNGGGRASVMAFGLELMGGKDVRNYYRGWGEWGNAEDTPVAVPTKK